LKAAVALTDVFRQQTLSYLKSTGLKLGILISFGTRRVNHVRAANWLSLIRDIRSFVIRTEGGET